MEKLIKYKPLRNFFISSCSLMFAGFFYADNKDWFQLALITLCTITGVFVVYRFNDFVDQSLNFHINLRRFFQIKRHRMMTLQFLVFLLPLSIFYLSGFSFIILALVGMLGIFYSINFVLFKRTFRLKRVFLFKNISIGLAWGALVLVGADTFENEFIQALFYFCSWQVFIGSSIRDISDLEKDKEENVQSLPVAVGVRQTFVILNILNFASVLTALIVDWNLYFTLMVCVTVIWRFIDLHMVQTRPEIKKWSEVYNLMTCLLIFILVFLIYLNGSFA